MWKHQVAFHRYSRTWMKSMMIVTGTVRAWAWAAIRSIWWLLPSSHPAAVVVGVAPVGLVEDLAHDGGGVAGDAGDQPLVLCDGSGGGVAVPVVGGGGGCQPVCGGGGGVVDGADLGHPLAVALSLLWTVGSEASGWSSRRPGRSSGAARRGASPRPCRRRRARARRRGRRWGPGGGRRSRRSRSRCAVRGLPPGVCRPVVPSSDRSR